MIIYVNKANSRNKHDDTSVTAVCDMFLWCKLRQDFNTLRLNMHYQAQVH